MTKEEMDRKADKIVLKGMSEEIEKAMKSLEDIKKYIKRAEGDKTLGTTELWERSNLREDEGGIRHEIEELSEVLDKYRHHVAVLRGKE